MQQQNPLIVTITGAAGQIGYIVSQTVASGQIFGDRRIILRLLDIQQCLTSLAGLKMELEDCAFPQLESVEIGSDPSELFKSIDVAIFIGGFPRKEGMERKELIAKNANIFKAQGIALNLFAKKSCKVLVVANPANTNCLILSKYAPSLPKSNFTCLTRLDHNRAIYQLSKKAHAPVNEVKNVIIWGNHSSTQYPDVAMTRISKEPLVNFINDCQFIQQAFISTVQQRGAEIIKARKASSAMSAAKAIMDHMRDWYFGTKAGEIVSMGVISDSNDYNIEYGLVYSFPCVCNNFEYKIIGDVPISKFSEEMLKKSERELIEERKEAEAFMMRSML